MDYSEKYKLACDLIKQGYLIHCTDNEFDNFDSEYIIGGSRAREGYGFYFSDMPYKPIEYGKYFYIIKKEDFNFIDADFNINKSNYLYNNLVIPYDKEIYKLEELLFNCRNNREYDEINNEIISLKEKQRNDQLSIEIDNAIKKHNLSTIGQIEQYIPTNYIKDFANRLKEIGYDGFVYDGIYTVFNFDKLNKKVRRYNIENSQKQLNEKKLRKLINTILSEMLKK